ncbi:MAG: alpha/beta fold hydrolase [Verrucomicrobiae bacterium]|nr:alpha/beta fold hydrolase [Verrucomicrobiae bacterium]
MTGIRRRMVFRIVAGVLLASVFAFQGVAFRHAWAMSHFSPAGTRTPRPEDLGLWQRIRVLIGGVSLPRPENTRTPESLGLPFEAIRFPSSAGMDLEAWRIRAAGPGPVVLLFSGYGGSKDGLLPVAAEFHRWGAEVWLVDFRGCGGSSGAITSIGFHEADDVAASVATVRKAAEGRPMILFGTSMGAAAVLRAVHVNGVQPDGLILECPFDRLLSTAANRFRLMKLPAFPLAHTLVFWGGVQLGFNGFSHNPVDYARSVKCPALLLQGDQDARVTWEQAEGIGRHLGSQGRLVRLAGVRHESYLAARPEQWRAEVGGFLNRLSAMGRGMGDGGWRQ